MKLTRSQIHNSRRKTHWKALDLMKRYYIHHPEDTTHYVVKKRKNKRGKLRYVFVYNVPDPYFYKKVLNGDFRRKYRVYHKA